MGALEAARLGDQIGHTNAMKGLLIGLAVGFLVTGAVLLLAGATIATGGAAAVVVGALIAGTAAGGLGGMKIGATIDSEPKGPIQTGSPNTFLGPAKRPAARAKLDYVLCADHAQKFIAEGSLDVFINNTGAARRTDKIVCAATIREGQPDVFFGGPVGTYIQPEEEVPSWLVTVLNVAAIVGSVIATGGAILTVGIGAALGGLGLGILGGMVGSSVLGSIGQTLGGDTGRAIGEVAGGFIGSLVGGYYGAKWGGALEAQLPSEILARLPGATEAHIQARMEVAREFYNNSPDFQIGGKPNVSRIDDHMSGIDFTKPVSVETLTEPTTYGQYQTPGGPMGNYLAEPGTPATELGIGPEARTAGGTVGPKVTQEVQVPAGTDVLRTTSAPKNDTWSASGTTQPAGGGGEQVFVGDKGVLTPVGPQQPADPSLLQPGSPFPATTGGTGVPVRGDGAFTPPNVPGIGRVVGGTSPNPDHDP